jgi:aerobic-type carbon monoxide dehydrogenase small subunit (CoxS/CutS family)
MTETEFRLTVNGAERSVACEPDTPLLDVLRHDLGLAGPKFGCGRPGTGRRCHRQRGR